jgi:hypothetical protein
VLLKKKLQDYSDLKKLASEIDKMKSFTKNAEFRAVTINQKELYSKGREINKRGKEGWNRGK